MGEYYLSLSPAPKTDGIVNRRHCLLILTEDVDLSFLCPKRNALLQERYNWLSRGLSL
jgi:hypothetical protein